MNMKAPLPADFKAPWWATKEFRRFVLIAVMGLAVVAVVIVDIGPKLSNRPVKAEKHDSNAFVPKPRTEGTASVLKFEGVLDKVKDGTPIDDQDEPYQYLIRSLSRMDAAQVAKDAKTVEYKYYSKMPVEMRGETAKIVALFLTSNPIRVDAAPGGVKFIHRTYLMDLRGDEGYVVDLLEPPGDLHLKTLVAIDGVFLKLGTYESKNGAVQAPLFIAKSLRTVKERMADSPALNLSGATMLLLAAGAMALMLVLTSFMFRKSKSAGPKGPVISMDTLKS
jgi:hypothetical protein